MMKTKKLVAVAMASMLATTTLVGCGGGNGSSINPDETTVLRVTMNDGGFGSDWLYEAARRFEEANTETEFEPGKKGVYVDVEATREERLATMSTDGYQIYFCEQSAEIRDMAQGGLLLEINEVLTEKSDVRNGEQISIEDKIPEEYRIALKARDGNYYGLPQFEYVPGLTFDQDLFDKNNLYIADETETAVTAFESSYGNANFVANKNAKKHCGNDGIYGTDDDGLPTSLQDMLILCAKMKQLGIYPFTFPGGHKSYVTNLEVGLWASLAGYEEMKMNYTFDGEMEVIDYEHPSGAFTNEPLFQGNGLSNIKKPRTKTITITEETGYKVYDSAARYYAMAFIQAAQALGWFSQDSETTTVSHTDAQGKFIYGGTLGNPKIGMLIEGCYWWNETEEKAQNLTSFFKDTGKTERNVKWMSLPTSLNGARPKEGEVRQIAFSEFGASYCVVNANIKDKPYMVEVCKQFLRFLYSDSELELYTKSTGTSKALMEYPVSDNIYASMDNYTKSFQNVVKRAANAKIVYSVADNPTYLASPSTFKLKQGNMPAVKVTYQGRSYGSHLEAMRSGISLLDIFEASRMNTSIWATYYVGE